MSSVLRCRCFATPGKPPAIAEYVTLSHAPCLLGVPLAALLTDVIQSVLMPIDLESGRPLLQRLVLLRSEVNRLLEERERRRRENLGWLTTHEAAASLGVDHDVLLRWMRQGLLAGERVDIDGRRPRNAISREALQVFQTTYLSSGTAATLLGIARSTVWKYVRKGILRPVAGRSTRDGGNQLLFLREQVAALACPDSLTVPEASALLDLSRSRVYSLIREGALPCLTLPKGVSNSLRLLLSEIEAFQQERRAPLSGSRAAGGDSPRKSVSGAP
jgi:predicted DNA-binding transcriptional regulator AlpA